MHLGKTRRHCTALALAGLSRAPIRAGSAHRTARASQQRPCCSARAAASGLPCVMWLRSRFACNLRACASAAPARSDAQHRNASRRLLGVGRSVRGAGMRVGPSHAATLPAPRPPPVTSVLRGACRPQHGARASCCALRPRRAAPRHLSPRPAQQPLAAGCAARRSFASTRAPARARCPRARPGPLGASTARVRLIARMRTRLLWLAAQTRASHRAAAHAQCCCACAAA